jgi:hypothetical protein
MSKGSISDLTGQEFGKLTVVEYAGRSGKEQRAFWYCRCVCGNVTRVRTDKLKIITSCGCVRGGSGWGRPKTHGDSRTRLYRIYRAMLTRCYNSKSDRFSSYGGRGIQVDASWRLCYGAFKEWALVNGYRDPLTIERKDVNGNYEPKNCTWIPLVDQSKNKRK